MARKNRPVLSSAAVSLAAARAVVRDLTFGTDAWEAAMIEVRRLCAIVNAERPAEEFCSVDSGIHRTRTLTGKVI